jgi:hypothetical protein
MLGDAFGDGQGGPGRIDRILALTRRLREIGEAISTIRYDENLVVEVPEVLRTLGDAKDAAVAELKTV